MAELFPISGADDVKREGISGLKNPMWWKVKTGSRWRGAAYVDEGGQAWLCAAGYRREKEGTDFYKAFMAQIKAGGPEPFLPTLEDRELLRLERKGALMQQWEAQLAGWARAWVLEALETEAVVERLLEDPKGRELALVSVLCEVEADSVVSVLLEFHPRNWSLTKLLDWAEQVFVGEVCCHEQHWAVTHIGQGRAYSLETDREQFRAAIATTPSRNAPGVFDAGAESHYTHQERIVDSMVEGEALKALCGQWFVPRQDPRNREQCPTCVAVHERFPAH
ncbi:DUF3039 domain-containing protein [Kocuria sp. CH-021]|uniref:DUF3039 domain-containing protein n=1 Tax=Kocuria sp. CH-021 TaxID=3406735 RepID=UPI003C76FB23